MKAAGLSLFVWYQSRPPSPPQPPAAGEETCQSVLQTNPFPVPPPSGRLGGLQSAGCLSRPGPAEVTGLQVGARELIRARDKGWVSPSPSHIPGPPDLRWMRCKWIKGEGAGSRRIDAPLLLPRKKPLIGKGGFCLVSKLLNCVFSQAWLRGGRRCGGSPSLPPLPIGEQEAGGLDPAPPPTPEARNQS